MVTLSPQPQASVWFGLLNTNLEASRVVFIPSRTFCTDVLHRRIALDTCVPMVLVLVRNVDEFYRPEDESSFRFEREESGGAMRDMRKACGKWVCAVHGVPA